MPPPAEFSLESVETLLRLLSSDDLGNLLATNNPPSDAQIMYIRETCLPAIDAGLSERVEMKVQTDIGPDVEPTLNTPGDYQHYFTNVRRQCEGILSHIRTLPAELLGEIFRHVAHYDCMWYYYTYTTGYQGVTSLSQVCARWRSLALQDPALWKSVNVEVQEHFRFTGSLRNRLARILERSRNHPLEIDVSVNKHWLGVCGRNVEPCRHLLAPLFEQVHRWRTAKLYLPYREELSRSLVHTGSGGAPLLETLDLKFHYNLGNDSVMFRNSPRLRTLIAGEGQCILDIPWEQLETLTWRPQHSYAAMKEYLGVLKRCKSLRRLTVDRWYYFRQENGPVPPALQLPDLTYLACEVPYLTKYLLVAPRLETVVIDNGCDDPDDLHCFAPLLERSSCYSTLTRLKYSKYDFAARADQFEILDALHQLDNLEYLTFVSRIDYSKKEESLGELRYDLEVVELIASLGDADGFLPRLRYLSLQLADHDAKGLFPYFGEEGDMVAAFERRWYERDAPLQAVAISIHHAALNDAFSRSPLAGPSQTYSACLTEAEETRLVALQNEGMKINLEIFGAGGNILQSCFADKLFREYRYE
ncbi:hypothetical protein C8J57DRAFT_1460649 [Mycena rebaudengoi]|nr:hypothetical protein C8J57DRAFT_1460649 [Mycena rebaudengoi]